MRFFKSVTAAVVLLTAQNSYAQTDPTYLWNQTAADQVASFRIKGTANFNDSYQNQIGSFLASANIRSGFRFESNGAINWGLNGSTLNGHVFRWLSSDNTPISYGTDIHELMRLTKTGLLGLGTITPESKLSVSLTDDNIYEPSSPTQAAPPTKIMTLMNMSTVVGSTAFMAFSTRTTSFVNRFYVGSVAANTNGGAFVIGQRSGGSSYEERLRIDDNGNVGIGTTNPTVKLAVNGDIKARKLTITTTNWPDYVFAKDYNLSPLSELAAYIEKHNHLPEIPSSDDVEANGLEVGEMNKLLLKKIEELTLHLINEHSQNAQLAEQVKFLQQEVNALKTK